MSYKLQSMQLSSSLQSRVLVGRVSVRRQLLSSPKLTSPHTSQQLQSNHGRIRDAHIARGSPSDTPSTPVKEKWWKHECPSNMKDVNSIQELVDAMAEHQDRLVIVDFYASWCNSCRALFPKLRKMAAENPDIVLLKVNFDENKQMCKSLGIKVLPFFQLYKGAEGRVDMFTCSIAKIQRMKDAIELHGAPFCSLEPVPAVPEFPEVTASGSTIDGSIDCLNSLDGQDLAKSNIVGFAKSSQQQQQASAV